mmetsp:Transcript_3099/g.12036  ORF Transcript_3099/g.12036 Transcript_3099/m.12036 type:complete len:474 (-) Transcript_3099:220-1641(-)
MGQQASVACAVDRAGFAEEEYQALRKALCVAEDDPKALVRIEAFMARFRGDLRALVHSLFAQLAKEKQGATSASWLVLVASLSALLQSGADWPGLLGAWAADVEPPPAANAPEGGAAAAPDEATEDVELYLELAASLCFWFAHPPPPPGSADRGGSSGGADATAAALETVVGALRLPSQGASDKPSRPSMKDAIQHLMSVAPSLPRAVGPALRSALLGAPAPPAFVLPEESRILDPGLIFLLRGMTAKLWESGPWQPLYRDWCDGRSFNGLLKGALHYEGSAMVLIRTAEGQLFGGVSTTWRDGHGKFGGCAECFLFALSPNLCVLRGESRGGNYVYLNANIKSYHPRGLGFGGQEGFHRLWLDADFEDCYVLESDATYGSGSLLPSSGLQTKFQVSRLEIWGFGGTEAAAAQAVQRQRDAGQRELSRTVDRAKLLENEFDKEMFFGKTFQGAADSREEAASCRPDEASKDES